MMIDDKTIVDKNFELEQSILGCWQIVDDIKDIVSRMEQGQMPKDDVQKILEAFADFYSYKFEHTFNVYETVCRALHQLRNTKPDVESTVAPKKSGKIAGSKRTKRG